MEQIEELLGMINENEKNYLAVQQWQGEVNTLLDGMMDCPVYFTRDISRGREALIRRYAAAGEKVYYIPMGGSNALGSLLAQILSDRLAGAPNRAFFQERLLDDLAYQGHIRALLNAALSARGEDVYALSDKAAAESLLRDLYRQELPALWPLKALPSYQVSLPWSRTFEVFAQV